MTQPTQPDSIDAVKRCSSCCRFFLALVAPLVGSMLASAAAPAPKESLSIDLGGGLTMEFVLVRPGAFAREDGNQVTITRPFYLAKTEVTQEQWERLMGSNPSFFRCRFSTALDWLSST